MSTPATEERKDQAEFSILHSFQTTSGTIRASKQTHDPYVDKTNIAYLLTANDPRSKAF